MAFHNVKLREDIAIEAVMGQRFDNKVVTLGAGNEKININAPEPRRTFRVQYNTKITNSKFTELLDFFAERKGKVHSFRWKDWSNFQVTEDTGVIKAFGDDHRLYRRSTQWPYTDRAVYLPVEGTVQFFDVDGTPVVDYETGIVTGLNSADGYWTGEFDIEVRFDSDEMLYKVAPNLIVVWDGVTIIEKIRGD